MFVRRARPRQVTGSSSDLGSDGPPEAEVDQEPVVGVFFFSSFSFLTAANGSEYNFATRGHVIMTGDTTNGLAKHLDLVSPAVFSSPYTCDVRRAGGLTGRPS